MDKLLLQCIRLVCVTAIVEGVQVTMPEKKKVAMLFQPALLQCNFSTSSTQPVVVQWRYKSYCLDRMEEALGLIVPGSSALSKKSHSWDPYLDCMDGSRTVRVVASKQGSVITLGEFYKEREVTIVHDADLQFGKLQWGDSGLYYCLVVTSDDLEGKNEDRVELLVMEWVFVSLVIIGTFLFFLMVGVCWCQCCPHSCCCYVRCPCCPETCCCPRALYEAGKAAKTGFPPNVPTACPSYYISTVPVAPVPPPVLMEKPHPPPLLPSDSIGGQNAVRKGYRIQADKERDSMKVLYYVEKELAQFDPARRMREKYSNTISELSSLQEDKNFGRSYRQVHRKTLPSSRDHDGDAHYWSSVVGTATRPGVYSTYREERERESFRNSQPRPTSELLERKAFPVGVQAVSTDELAAFADSYKQRPRRAESRSSSRVERPELRGRPQPQPQPQYQDSSLEEYYGKRNRGRELFSDSERGWSFSPTKLRAPEEKHPPKRVGRMGQSYDDAYMSSVLDRKSRGGEESSSTVTPSKMSLRQTGGRYGWSTSSYKSSGEEKVKQAEEEDTLPPYSEKELGKAPPYRTREHGYLSSSEKRKKKEQPNKTGDFPNRMSLVV